jgi:cytochrome oxidase Cu insertion factor (SCO1/SenC/PrrC family)
MQHLKPACILMMMLISHASWSQKQKEKIKPACCSDSAVTGLTEAKYFSLGNMKKVPDAELINQEGKKVKFRQLIKGKVVALNFIFTTCKTICPPMGANFAGLKKLMDSRVQSSELVMLTISIDPDTDTPDRLKAWSEKFDAGPGWTLLTGKRQEVFDLLKSLEVYSAVKEEHAPIVLLGKEGTDKWVRANGLSDPAQLATTLKSYFDKPEPVRIEQAQTKSDSSDENYFTNVVLIDQNGNKKQLFSDLMKDKVVIINAFFSECKGVCPVMSTSLQKIQEHLGDKMGKTVNIISMTVDYKTDKPDVLKTYAEGYKAGEGWYFVTGEKENIELALKKLGKNVSSREQHDAIFLVGNLKTKLWKKVNGLSPVNQIIDVIDSVINDKGE